MTISSVDQMYRVEQMSDDGGLMFPKGPKQMLGFVFSMEGEIARQQTWHAKMIALRESFESGYIRPFSMHVKVTRLKALAQNPTKPNFEGKLDTLYDLINYAVFYIEYLRSNAEPAAASPVGPEYPTGYVPRKVGD